MKKIEAMSRWPRWAVPVMAATVMAGLDPQHFPTLLASHTASHWLVSIMTNGHDQHQESGLHAAVRRAADQAMGDTKELFLDQQRSLGPTSAELIEESFAVLRQQIAMVAAHPRYQLVRDTRATMRDGDHTRLRDAIRHPLHAALAPLEPPHEQLVLRRLERFVLSSWPGLFLEDVRDQQPPATDSPSQAPTPPIRETRRRRKSRQRTHRQRHRRLNHRH